MSERFLRRRERDPNLLPVTRQTKRRLREVATERVSGSNYGLSVISSDNVHYLINDVPRRSRVIVARLPSLDNNISILYSLGEKEGMHLLDKLDLNKYTYDMPADRIPDFSEGIDPQQLLEYAKVLHIGAQQNAMDTAVLGPLVKREGFRDRVPSISEGEILDLLRHLQSGTVTHIGVV